MREAVDLDDDEARLVRLGVVARFAIIVDTSRPKYEPPLSIAKIDVSTVFTAA